jgi:mannose-6-phosphate isomerase
VWLGLREDVEPARYRSWIEEQDTDALLGSLNHMAVGPGDVVFVPAGVPHAIGGGALILELQEPTDYSILCEWEGFPVNPRDAHLGLGWELAFDALRLEAYRPRLGFPDEADVFFRVDERVAPAGRFAVLVVLEGEGEIDGERVRAGDAFAMPAAAQPFEVHGDLRVLRCMGGK